MDYDYSPCLNAIDSRQKLLKNYKSVFIHSIAGGKNPKHTKCEKNDSFQYAENSNKTHSSML